MSRRLAARVITGPAAFLFGALIELAAYAFASLRARGRRRWRPVHRAR